MGTEMPAIMNRIKGKLVVSCQAYPGDPLEDTETIRRIASAAVRGGAAGLRLNGAEDIAAVRRDTGLPIIGINKKYWNDQLRITPDFASAAEVAHAGADIIALDCTNRVWPAGDPWQQIIARIHSELKLLVMADIATLAEALNAAAAGADMVGMTLNGYTEETSSSRGFSWPLLHDLLKQANRPVIAEGHISTPDEARRAIARGAWSVVVGSAITRPGVITAGFVQAMERPAPSGSAVAIDIGSTYIKSGLVDRAGEVSLADRILTRASGGRDAIAAGASLAIQSALTLARERGIDPIGLGIATGGAIDARDGTVFGATDNLPGWAGFDLRGFAVDRFHLPTWVNNDAHAAALAELHFGMGRGVSDFVAITIGTGVGGGIVSGGKLMRGCLGFAGSFGHHTIRFDGRPCNCGRRGCLEAYVSTASLIHEYRELSGQSLNVEDAESALKISQLASAGDSCALEAYSILAGYLGEAAANLFNILDPKIILISGGLVEGHPHFAAQVEDRVTKLIHFGAKRRPRIQMSAAGQFTGLQGAAASVFEAHDEATTHNRPNFFTAS
jgi:putative N-acetylmannosamine-6-phosphate epimerase/predicted NBD/HSP70 family sugar kinase